MRKAQCCGAKYRLFFKRARCIVKTSKTHSSSQRSSMGPATPPPPGCWSVSETRRTSSRAGFSVFRRWFVAAFGRRNLDRTAPLFYFPIIDICLISLL